MLNACFPIDMLLLNARSILINLSQLFCQYFLTLGQFCCASHLTKVNRDSNTCGNIGVPIYLFSKNLFYVCQKLTRWFLSLLNLFLVPDVKYLKISDYVQDAILKHNCCSIVAS